MAHANYARIRPLPTDPVCEKESRDANRLPMVTETDPTVPDTARQRLAIESTVS